MILLIDTYDSFVHNLARYVERLGQETLVVRNDATTPAGVRQLEPQAIIISPGPCSPAGAGCSVPVVAELAGQTPILGVCLGHQAIAAALGARVVRAAEPRHGRTSRVRHQGTPLFAGVPTSFTACRYHSLAVDQATLPADLRATAHADDGCIMALEHQRLPLWGLQFHPEATLTTHGYRLLRNFLELAGCPVAGDAAALAADEWTEPSAPSAATPQRPVTF
ncbi:MAG TPA: aminodeoxychorismate/anthranilate synthase component II [Lacipirellulaceae bacterium]|nr:aminodeoxychorismate/anthranilate synthase component II [Lacipirellulaceae bacterium]